MRVARWKVMAGGLLLSAGGLMAVADGPPAVPLPGCQPAPVCLPPLPAPAAPAVTRVSLEAPIAVPAPNVVELPPPAPSLPPLPKAEQSGLAVPPIGTPKPDPTPGPPIPDLPSRSIPAPLPKPEPFVPVTPRTDPTPPPAPFVPAAAPAPAVPAEKSAPELKKPEPVPSAAEKRLKVVLHMGDDRPRFEVRDGDEIYLKVVSDRVEVKSAADKGDAPTMKAGGKVAFVTPGGDGTCDELTILPGSGQVVAAGNVAFRHTWGRSETTVTAERMTFRLAHPGPTAIQAGYTPVR